MHRGKLVLGLLVGLVATMIVWRVGFYVPDADFALRTISDARGASSASSEDSEPAEETRTDDKPDANAVAVDSNSPGSGPEPNQAAIPAEVEPIAEPADAHPASKYEQFPDPNAFWAGSGPSQTREEPLEALNLKDVEMKFIIQKIADWTGKVVIPADEAMRQKVTIYAPGLLPRSEALEHIYGALRIKGYTVEHADRTIYLRPIGDARIGLVPTIPADQPLAAIENKEQIVQKFFRLANYSPSQMAQIVQPLIGEYGHVNADEMTSTLLVIDTVANLMRVETIIAQFDIVQAEPLETKVFELHHRTPGEIVQLLQALLADSVRAAGSGSAIASRPIPQAMSSHASDSRFKSKSSGKTGTGTASSVVLGGGGQRPMLLISEPRFNWVIAKAGPEDMNEISGWIERLDQPVPSVAVADSLDDIENKNQIVQRFVRLEHCTPDRMADIVAPLMGDAGRVVVEDRTGTLLLVDTVENLLRIESLIARFDVPEPEDGRTRVFELQHRDPQEIAVLLEAVLGDGTSPGASSGMRSFDRRSGSSWASSGTRGYDHRSSRSSGTLSILRARAPSGRETATGDEQPITFIPEPNRRWIIVRASPEDMEAIADWIARLDKPIPIVTEDRSLADIETRNQIVQRFISLKHYDPIRMSEIVTPLLTESGHITAEESTRTLLLIDTVENLLRIEAVISQFDEPQADHIATEIFEVRQRTPEEVIQLLQTILSDQTNAAGMSYGRRSPQIGRTQYGSTSRSSSVASGGGNASTVTGPGGRPIVLVPESRQGWIIAKASPEDMNEIGRWVERLDQAVKTITEDVPLATIENKNQVVQKCIKLHSYSPSRMGEIVLPLLSESGYVSADESTRNLLLIDTVENLIRIETIIAQFDVPEAEQTMSEVFEIRHADPAEVVQLLRLLLSDGTSRAGSRSGYNGRSPYPSRSSSSSRLYRSGASSASATSIIVGPSEMPVVLIPEPRRRWIIARASAEDMTLLRDWIERLDQGESTEREYETVPITYADVREVAMRLNEALQQMPGTELQASVLVQALEQARQVMIFGRQDLREMVKKLITEIDVPPGQFITEHFQIRHADPDQIKRNIDELYGEAGMAAGRTGYSRYPGTRPGGVSPDTVKVISHVSLKQVTVTASPENVKLISEQILRWDVAIDVNEVKPRIVELRNCEPTQMATVLRTLFSEEMSSRYSFYDYLFGGSSANKQRIIGPLYGQLTFEEMPGTRKLIVISNVPQAYGVVEELIEELDSREAAEVPRVIRLNYAHPERLAERLNAMFNEAGTSVAIRLSEQGLRDYSMENTATTGNNTGNRNTGGAGGNDASPQEYRPWWTTGQRSLNALPISNIIGRVRFVPDTYSKSILVLSPPEFMESIEATIKELDIPGKQVMIKAIILQVDHQNMTSLGVQVSSDPTKWETLDNENAVVAWNTLSLLEEHGSLVVSPTGVPISGTGSIIGVNANIGVLIDFLIRQLDAKILNQQTLWTKDNEEAEFFKGQRVGFQTRVSISDTGGRATSDFSYEKVGMTLRARPSVTPEDNVDMIINVILSQLASEVINNQRVRTELDTTTNMIVRDGQTIMLGGMLFQEDSRIKRRIPLLGDLPLVGGLFRHNRNAAANSELLIFVTPFVIDTPERVGPEAAAELDRARRKLDDVREQLAPPTMD